MDEIRPTINRRRIEELVSNFDASRPDAKAAGNEACLVKTKLKTTYPTVAGRYYYCEIQRLGGDPVEGGAGTVTATGQYLFAWNRGGAVPPQGTLLLAQQVGGRWTIRYD
jgi:hypothetical protein